MRIKKSPASAKRLAHMPPSLANFISTLETCPQPDLAEHIRSFGPLWDQPRGDLHHWIPVLNRFDEILETAVNKSGLRANMPSAYVFSADEEDTLVAILDFSALLLEECSHRSLYASGSYLSNLLYTTSLPILISTLKVCARLAQRYAQANSGRSSIFVISLEKMYKLANSFPPPTPVEITQKVSLYDFVDPSKEWDSSWSDIHLQYYKDTTNSLVLPEVGHPATPSPLPLHKGGSPGEPKAGDGMLSFTMSSNEVAHTSLDGLLNRVFTEIPKHFLVEVFLKTRSAKAFAPGSESLKMRRQLVAVRCLAIEFLGYTAQENSIQTRLFAGNPQLIPSLCDLIHPDNDVPIWLRTLAIEALQSLSHHRAKHNEILSSLSANVNHGVLLYIVRQIVKDLSHGQIVDAYFADRLMNLIPLLASSSHSVQVLVTAGFMSVMVQLLETPTQDFTTLAMAITVVQHMVCVAQSAFNEFVQLGGLDFVVKRIEEEVDYSIANPEDIEQTVLVDFRMNYVRAQFLKSLFKLLLSMMASTGNADRLRNLVESSILNSLKKVISNSALFGTNVVSCAIDMMSTFIHNEPTSYTIIGESKLPQVFVDSIPELIKLSKTTSIPHAIGAICLNNAGLDLVQKSGALKKYFQVFKMHFHAQIMTLTSVPSSLGSAFDEMVRHHPALKEEIMAEVVQVAKDISLAGEAMSGGVRFFPVRADALKTDADDELVIQDANSEIMSLIDCYARFLEAFLQNNVHCKEFIKRDGLVYLVRLYSLPSLPYDFPSRAPAISLTRVFRLATEVNTFWTITTILKACSATMKKIDVFLDYDDPDSFFKHLETEDGDLASQFMKSLNSVHCFVFLLSQMYAHMIYPHSKSTLPMIQPFSTVNEFEQLLTSFGKLQRNCLWEDVVITKGLSEEWRDASRVISFEEGRNRYNEQERKNEVAEAEAKIDVTDNRYKNIKIVRYMMSQVPGTLSKIFAGLSKLTLSRRIPDASQKKHGFSVGEMLAKALVASLSYSRIDLFQDKRDKYAYWVLLLSASRNILFDVTDQRVSTTSLQTVVAICFKRQGGIELLIKVLESLWYELRSLPPADDGDKSILSKQAMTFGDVVVLQIFSTLVNMKSVLDSSQTGSLAMKERDRDRPEYFNQNQFLVELRLAVLPTIKKLWESEELLNASSPVLKILIGILASIMNADGESGCIASGDREWSSDQLTAASFQAAEDGVRQLMDLGFARPVVEVALRRSSNQVNRAADLLIANRSSLSYGSGAGTPLGTGEIGPSTQPGEDQSESSAAGTAAAAVALAALIDPATSNTPTGPPDVESDDIDVDDDPENIERAEHESGDRSAGESDASDGEIDYSGEVVEYDGEDTPMADPESSTSSTVAASKHKEEAKSLSVSELNGIRDEIRKDVIPRTLTILETHPEVVFELSNLLNASFGGKLSSVDMKKQTVMEIVGHLSSIDISDEKSIVRIKSTAHLLGLHLQNEAFFAASLSDLRKHWDLFIRLLRFDRNGNDTWVPDVLLIVERILSDAEQPRPVTFEHNLSGAIVELDQVPMETKAALFDAIMNLPTVKSETTAAAVARVLVILTRKYEFALAAFEKGAIGSLFTAIQNVSGDSKLRLQNYASILLRHVIDSSETLETLIAIEIRNWFSQPRARPVDVQSFIRGNSHVVVRSPETFVKVTNSICKLVLSPEIPSRQQSIILKSQGPRTVASRSDASQGEGDDSKKVDDEDKEMTDAKPADTPLPSKVLSLEKTTGVMQYLLNELFATKEDPQQQPDKKEGEGKVSDQAQKVEFNPLKHPQFLYRAFLLEVLTELLASYNQCKLEFISYSRRGQTFNTPSKPRLAVLNYFLYELLPTGGLITSDDIQFKKRVCISNIAVKLLYALVSGTGEHPENGEEDLTILHIRKFVLDATLRAFKDVSTSSDPLGVRYSRLLNLGTLCYKFLNGRSNNSMMGSKNTFPPTEVDDNAMAKIMFEKSFVGTLTTALNEIDLNFPGAQKVVRMLLRPLTKLARASIDLADVLTMTKPHEPAEEEYFSTDSGPDEYREETPNFFSNSALGMYEVEEGVDYDEDGSEISGTDDGGEDMEYEEDDDDEDDEDADEDVMEYADEEMNYEDDEESEDDLTEEGEDDVGDEDEDHMNVEIVVEEIHHDDDSNGDDNDEGEQSAEEDNEDELDAESIQDYEEDDEWQDELDGDDMEDFGDPLDEIARALGDDGDTPEQEGEVDEDEEDEEEPEDGEESDDVVPTDDMDYADDIDQDGDDEPNFGWEIEEIGTYDEMFPTRRNPHIFSNTGIRGSGIPGWSDLDTATNPLLVQPPNEEIASALSGSSSTPNDLPYRPYYSRRLPTEGDLRVLNDLFQQVVRHHHHRAGNTGEFGGNDVIITRDVDPVFGYHPSRMNRQSREDPWSIVSTLSPKSTLVRWQEEARILFSTTVNDKASQVINHILNFLLPIAIKEDQDRKAAEAEGRRKERERLEKEEQEKRERERAEAERKAAEEAEANARRQAEESNASVQAAAVEGGSTGESKSNEMEDVESSAVPEDTESAGVSSEPRMIVTVGGREVDVTGMGIDPSFLEALPEDMREEVLASHIREVQSSNTPNIGEPESEIEAEFLAALPPNIREELLQQEAAERRRLQRERELRDAPTENPASDIDFATFLATLDPTLRQTILAEQDEEALAHLPPTIADEAHELQRRHNLHTINDFLEIEPPARGSNGHRLQRLSGTHLPDGPGSGHHSSRNGIQLVDRAGIASLVRLLYLPQTSNQRSPLYDMLVSVTANRQSRAELFNMILSILQDGSTDVASVERSFSQIWARARPQLTVASNTPTKPSATPKTPVTPAKGIVGPAHHGSAEVSPLVLAQQCLQALDHIIKANRQLASYFLIEHESPIGLKRTMSRKGKLKDVSASKAHKYPINTLLALLDRPMIRDSASAMDMLSMLFQEITRPLQVLVKRSMEEEEKETAKETNSNHEVPADANVATNEVTGKDEPQPGQSTSAAKVEEIKQPQRKLSPPVIPEHNLCLLVNILTARECPNRTLQQTLAAMQNLSAVPGAKDIFGSELIRQAQELGQSLPRDLRELTSQINQAKSGSDIQGMALSRFSPASSDQAKLLRVLTAVDYLFDPEREKKEAEGRTDDASDDILIRLYSGLDFGLLWKALGEVLREIQERSDMLHVATVLLPLIEAFMVVCKYEVLRETPKPTQPSGKVVRLDTGPTNPAPDNMQHLFFKFTDEHRKILNQMVRNNPKLMSGSFSILVKNPKVLDFDNKRNFFNRQLHARSQAVHIHRALSLNVRREQVFLDSYKALYFKTGDEIKYSKLNIRFHGEEGVDAGGVTREWFQVLARQMFNPDYALFTPVASDRTTFHPNRTSGVNPEHLLFFKFIGRIIGKALYEGRVLDCHFSRAVYKRILGRQVSLKDMETLDLEYYKSLVWMLENDITDVITETMSLEADDYGDKKIIDLVPNGRDIPVTEENKHEYVKLVVGYRLLTSVEEQLESFLNGFYDIVPKDLISIFNEQELELLISGLPDIDVDDWRNNTVYVEYQNYSPSSPQIQWFWRAVRAFDAEERAKLLQFVTGTSKVPLNGFAELEGMNGVSRFSIHRDYGHKDRLPSSHTCFNQLDMPEYESYDALRNAVLLAITEGREGFGFAWYILFELYLG
ncbi:hypothetical protein V1506DRAFT_457070 [Lipomyces tetrasporus]